MNSKGKRKHYLLGVVYIPLVVRCCRLLQLAACSTVY